MVNAMDMNGWGHAHCILHILHLIITHLILEQQSEIKNMTTRAEKLVAHFRCSPKSKGVLRKHKKELKMP